MRLPATNCASDERQPRVRRRHRGNAEATPQRWPLAVLARQDAVMGRTGKLQDGDAGNDTATAGSADAVGKRSSSWR